MAIVPLETVKEHVRVDGDAEDAILAVYRDAAEAQIIDYLDRPIYPVGTVLPAEAEEGYEPFAITADPAIIAAVLLMTALLYEGREAGGEGNAAPPMNVRMLLAPWRVWRLTEDEVTYADI